MGKRSREHRAAVIAGTEKPFRTSLGKIKVGEQPELSAAEKVQIRLQKLKEQQGG